MTMKKVLLPGILVLAGLVVLLIYFNPFATGNVDVKIQNANYIMPAAYKVYANPDALNGEYYFFKALITNNGDAPLKNLKVSYQVPNYLDWTELETVPIIYPGEHLVVRCYPHFKDDIVNKMTQSQEKGEVKIEYNGSQEKTKSFGFNIMGRNQFVYTDIPPDEATSYPDMMHNTQLLPSLVTPEDPVVKYYTQQVQEKLMHGEAASVSNKNEDAVKFLEELYAGTYLSHMVYSGTEGIPQKLGDVNSLVQSIRLPREVITGNTGLCIELSLFYCSVLKAAGLHPIIFLIPGHAYPGVLVNGQYYAIEATGVNGEGLGGRYRPDDALKVGMKNLQTFVQAAQQGDSRYMIIDVNALEGKGVVPMELRDDDFLRKKVDEIAVAFNPGAAPVDNRPAADNVGPRAQPAVTRARRSSGGGGEGRGTSGMASYAGAITFNYPAGWQRFNHPIAGVPALAALIQANQFSSISVYNISGTSSPEQAVQYIQQLLAQNGQSMQYQRLGDKNGYFFYQGVTNSSGGQFQWQAVFRQATGGISGIACGSSNYGAMANIYSSIFSTVR
ncbi:hypothetical protein HHL22_03105 [Hymenobacter sp. RP-2-7]|uniref:Uncharacterized protein n=1 Tax=Hymenobacter polaris TaxID=2682546 RepID=A0A7Y0FL61_9BACT|nr:hypothetical protein [Hymenobacter polaris]NML64185.1 hypothetical protein [Hymenobacter polaris]